MMDEKTLAALTALANKLGTTAERLWGVLVRQAPISATVDLAMLAVLVILTAIFARILAARSKADQTADDMSVPVLWLIVGVFSVVTSIAAANILPTIAAAFLNPEYWALQQLLK